MGELQLISQKVGKKIREDGYEPDNRFYLFDLINFVVLSRENYTAKCLIKVSETK